MEDRDFIHGRMGQRRHNEQEFTAMRRTAKEVSNYRFIVRALSIVLVMLIIVTMAVYLVAVLYRNSGRFSVMIDKYEMTKSHPEVCGTPRMIHLSSGTTVSLSTVHPIRLSNQPQNFLHIVFCFTRLKTFKIAYKGN